MDYTTTGHHSAKLLIDECLNSTLATMARERGFPASTHVTWIGLGGNQDWSLVRYAIAHDYAVVTNNRKDFTRLMLQEPHHPGLICLNFAHGHSSFQAQQMLFARALDEIGAAHWPDNVHDVTLEADRTVRITSPAFP